MFRPPDLLAQPCTEYFGASPVQMAVIHPASIGDEIQKLGLPEWNVTQSRQYKAQGRGYVMSGDLNAVTSTVTSGTGIAYHPSACARP